MPCFWTGWTRPLPEPRARAASLPSEFTQGAGRAFLPAHTLRPFPVVSWCPQALRPLPVAGFVLTGETTSLPAPALDFGSPTFWPQVLVLGGVVLLVLLVATWNILLRRRVQRATLELRHELERSRSYARRLAESESRYRLVLEGTREGIWDNDLLTGTVFFSARWKEMLGYAEHELANQMSEFQDRVHPEDRPLLDANWQQILDGSAEHCEVVLRLRHKDGSYRAMRTWAGVLRDTEGRPVRLAGAQQDITTELQAKERLELSEQTYRELFNATTDAVILHHPVTLRIVDANEAFLKLFGFEREEVPSLNLQDISQGEPPFDLEGVRAIVRSLDTTRTRAVEWRSRRKDGGLFWSEGLITMVSVAGERLVLASLRDISRRLQTLKALQEREKTLQGILDAAPMVICLVNRGSIVWSNSYSATVLGLPPEQVQGLPLQSLFPGAKAWLQASQTFEAQLEEQGLGQVETTLLARGGRPVEVTLSLAPLDLENPTGEVIVCITDISERKRWEKALVERETRYRDIFQNAPVGILRTTIEGGILNMNRALAQILGYPSPLEALNALRHDIHNAYADPADLEALHRALEERGAVQDFEVHWLDREGKERIVSLSVRTLMEAGLPLIDGFAVDVTEKRQAQLLARQREEQLLQADKLISLGTLTAGVAHEVNNPNNFIAINAPLLKKAWEGLMPVLDGILAREGDFMAGALPYSRLRGHVPRLIEGILAGSQRITGIVEGMKDFARPEAPGRTEPVDLNFVVQTALGFMNTRIAKSGALLDVRFAEELPPVLGSAQQLEQVVLNLALNALDTMPQPGGRLELVTERSEDGGTVCLLVRDQGEGISPDVLRQIFDPFFTTKRGRGGTGLGLSISQKIVHTHGGTLELRNNTPAPGITALVCLPAAKHDSESAR